jgi:hypothetical protein
VSTIPSNIDCCNDHSYRGCPEPKLTLAVILLGFVIQLPAVLLSGLDYVLVVDTGSLKGQMVGIAGQNTSDIEMPDSIRHYSQLTAQYGMVVQKLRYVSSIDPSSESRAALETARPNANSRCKWDFWWCR